MRKIIHHIADLCNNHALNEWRQYQYNIKQLKRLMRIAQKTKRGRSKKPEQQSRSDKAIKEAHREYIISAQKYLDKAKETVKTIEESGMIGVKDIALIEAIAYFTSHAQREIDQINRRVLQDETIPHEEKVFSIFQPHTEWIVKGKAGVPFELGIRVSIIEDQYQFILHHRVMEKETDDKVAIPMVKETKERFPELSSCSFDKGYHSKENQEILKSELDVVALPRKGRLSKEAQAIEGSDEFIKAHKKHSAVESAINALEVHGLDKCHDNGISGFKRYVALAVVGKNVDRIGTIIKRREQKQLARKKHRPRDGTLKLAA